MAIHLQFLHMGMSAKDVANRFMGIYEAQFDGFRQAGMRVSFSLDSIDSTADFIICTADNKDIERALSTSSRPLILYVPPIDQWFDQPLLQRVKPRVAFAYGPCLSGMTTDAYAKLGIAYHFLSFAADPNVMKPLNLEPEYDLAFLGGLQHRRGYQPYIEPLLRQLDPAKLAFIGGGWPKYKIPVQAVHGLMADSPGPPERMTLTNKFYNLAKICINFHAPEQTRGPAIQLDCNNRVFDLTMAGCVQVSDNPDGVHMHFSEGEVLTAAAPQEWVKLVMDSLSRPASHFSTLRAAGRNRALAEHTWRHRGETFLSWISQHA